MKKYLLFIALWWTIVLDWPFWQSAVAFFHGEPNWGFIVGLGAVLGLQGEVARGFMHIRDKHVSHHVRGNRNAVEQGAAIGACPAKREQNHHDLKDAKR